jgi:integrase
VFIGTEGVAILRRYFDTKVEMLGHDPDGWLLSLDGGTTPLRAKSVSDYMTTLSRRLKIPAHFHTLRHFSATELVHAGVDLPTAAGQMGHSIGVMSEVYLHSSDERGAAAGELIAGVVGKALAPG